MATIDAKTTGHSRSPAYINMATAQPVMCGASMKSTKGRTPPAYRGLTRRANASIVSSASSEAYAVRREMMRCAHACSKPSTVWPRRLRTVIAMAKRLSAGSRRSLSTVHLAVGQQHGVDARLHAHLRSVNAASAVAPSHLDFGAACCAEPD